MRRSSALSWHFNRRHCHQPRASQTPMRAAISAPTRCGRRWCRQRCAGQCPQMAQRARGHASIERSSSDSSTSYESSPGSHRRSFLQWRSLRRRWTLRRLRRRLAARYGARAPPTRRSWRSSSSRRVPIHFIRRMVPAASRPRAPRGPSSANSCWCTTAAIRCRQEDPHHRHRRARIPCPSPSAVETCRLLPPRGKLSQTRSPKSRRSYRLV